MTSQSPQSRILQAVDALRACDRDNAVRLLEDELRLGPATGERWRSVSRLAGQIGEIDVSIEAARRFSRTEPVTLERLLNYWAELAQYGRTEIVHAEMGQLPEQLREHPSVLHLCGTVASQEGDFADAERCYRQALARRPHAPQTWFALAMIKKFGRNDPDLLAMERLRPKVIDEDAAIRAPFLFGLAKAWHDCGEYDRAFELYEDGAALRRKHEKWDFDALERFAEKVISDFTPRNLVRLVASTEERPAVFVNGLPRSGTTLAEQILVANSKVADGGELNLLRAALIPCGDFSLSGALSYQQRALERPDPWGDIAATYFRLLRMRFRTSALVVDKTLIHSHLMGLLMHALPNAQVIWMRRDPEDTALSCFRTFFAAGVSWSWSLEDIARFFRIEDRLYAHWSAIFPDRILTVDYEGLVSNPQDWIPRIADHCGLELETTMFEPHRKKRGVQTASVQQVRQPITRDRIGSAGAYSSHLDPFRKVYFA